MDVVLKNSSFTSLVNFIRTLIIFSRQDSQSRVYRNFLSIYNFEKQILLISNYLLIEIFIFFVDIEYIAACNLGQKKT